MVGIKSGGLLALAGVLAALSVGIDFANALMSRLSDLLFVGAAGILVVFAMSGRSRSLKAKVETLEVEKRALEARLAQAEARTPIRRVV